MRLELLLFPLALAVIIAIGVWAAMHAANPAVLELECQQQYDACMQGEVWE